MTTPLRQDDRTIADLAFGHLQKVVAIDSQSDETSETIPSTEGQRVLAAAVAEFFEGLGARIERDAHANIIAGFEGRGAGADAEPLALMVHLDTARGTAAVERLEVVPAWRGDAIPYPANPALEVSLETYPAVAEFEGQDVVHGAGDAPFGLDDKLGLTHMMTMAVLLRDNPGIAHPPLLLIGRPDEEVGRMAAVEGLAELLAGRGVRSGYTVDGILPFEVNVENFNAAHAAVCFPARPLALPTEAFVLPLTIGGVNTHGATAKAEGHRAATRFAPDLLAHLGADGGPPVAVVGFVSDALRDCDGVLRLAVTGDDAAGRIESACEAVIGPHVPRGASWSLGVAEPAPAAMATAAGDALSFVARFLASEPGFVLAAEDSEGRQGYSAPFRVRDGDDGAAWVDVRLRDFDPAALEARKHHVRDVAAALDCRVDVQDQYVNMGPRLADRPELTRWAMDAGRAIGVDVRQFPIRGGTGVDPFLARGVAIANVGTGYFAPESEKELTSKQMMARHARWLVALVETIANDPC